MSRRLSQAATLDPDEEVSPSSAPLKADPPADPRKFLNPSDMKAYTGRESLPERDGTARGEPRFFVNGRKLIGVFQSNSGVERRLFATIYDKTPQGKTFRAALRKAGIPGA